MRASTARPCPTPARVTHSLPKRAAAPRRNHQGARPRQPRSSSLLPPSPKDHQLLLATVGLSSPKPKTCPQEGVRQFTRRDQSSTGLKLTRRRRTCILPGLKVRHQRNGPLEAGFQVATRSQAFLGRDLAHLTTVRGSEGQGLGHLLCPKETGTRKGIVWRASGPAHSASYG